MNNKIQNDINEKSGIGHIILRLIGTAIVLAVTAFLTPRFSIDGIWALIIASIVITFIDYLIEKLTGIDASPFGRGFVGFIVSVAIIYFTKYIVSGFEVTILGSILGALVIGIINAITPGKTM
ncbi:phage holin family protein [Defluviitalea phaphyphila]|uniref:phage holin family protein n=1 Tax=Defluviitalea phaphyphila TaxID=1473580 RepID=UPI000730FF9F|nr:phage holin family protein [Defluviitalea phaphyphila]